MSGNLLEGCNGPESQSLGAVQALLRYQNKNIDQLPGVVLLDNLALVLSAKRDQYYTTTPKACSCPSFVFRGKRCKHMKAQFPERIEYIDGGPEYASPLESKSEIQRIPDEVCEEVA